MTVPDAHAWPVGQVGYAAIVGRTNVGKSTFFNRALNVHLAAVSAQPQTTRRHWRGIFSDAHSQIVFVDTPGVYEGKTELNHVMLQSVKRSLDDADAVVLICDPSRTPGREDEGAAKLLRQVSKPMALALNKSDVTTAVERRRTGDFYRRGLERTLPVLHMSALTGEGMEALLGWIRQQLPRGPFFYPPDQVTDAFERDIGSELIREAALEHLRQEVPHALAVEIEQWREAGRHVRIRALLHVERDNQRLIVVGRRGDMLAEIRRRAVVRLRELCGRRVDLSLHVKVSRDWRQRPRFLRDLGLHDG